MASRMNANIQYEKEALKQFRLNLEDILTTDDTDAILIKWLRTANFNIKKAEENFRQVYIARKFYMIKEIKDNYVKPEVYEKYETNSFIGFAKDGSLLRYVGMKFDVWGFLRSSSTSEMCQYFICVLEGDLKTVREESFKNGKNINEITYIIDMEGFQLQDVLHRNVIELGLDLLSLFQEWYPESWNYIFIVNAPYFIDKFVGLFKCILQDSLLSKAFIANKNSTGNLLREYIDEDVLPAFLGGKKVDSEGDPRCGKLFKTIPPGNIPEEYFLKNRVHYIDSTDPGVTVVDIAARSVHNVPIVIKNAGSRIREEIRTENGSIYCHQLYKEFGEDSENLDVPSSNEYFDLHDKNCNVRMLGSKYKMLCHLAPVDFEVSAIFPGIYIMQFDNSKSWFSSRKLFYRFTVISGDSQK